MTDILSPSHVICIRIRFNRPGNSRRGDDALLVRAWFDNLEVHIWTNVRYEFVQIGVVCCVRLVDYSSVIFWFAHVASEIALVRCYRYPVDYHRMRCKGRLG